MDGSGNQDNRLPDKGFRAESVVDLHDGKGYCTCAEMEEIILREA